MVIDGPTTQDLLVLRRRLHDLAEPAGAEVRTAACLADVLRACGPSRLIEGLGGHGLAAVFGGSERRPGPTVMLRAELDAVPTDRPNGAAHLCGHDGHLAALAGIARARRRSPLVCGRLVLLFQPAEETGRGAQAVLADSRWAPLAVDHAYAVHNLPGHRRGSVLIREGTWAAGQQELRALLTAAGGAAPDPGGLVADLVALPLRLAASDPQAVVVVDHAVTGGTLEIRCDLRAARPDAMTELQRRVEARLREEAEARGAACRLDWSGGSPALVGGAEANAVVGRAARAAGLDVECAAESPLHWSEDFGWFLQRTPGAMVGLGAGAGVPPLHARDYAFPDALLPIQVRLQEAILAEHGLLAGPPD